ncbi:hypothetical protein CY35_19G029000 [Sphagnum magellanicum]|nr:hypothetical protein CY35_19G029000 [Sphagnum magellanicum]
MLLGVKLLELFLRLWPLRSLIQLLKMAQLQAACHDHGSNAAKKPAMDLTTTTSSSATSDLYVSLELHAGGGAGDLGGSGSMISSSSCAAEERRPRVISVLSSLLDRVVARNETQILALNHSICPQKMTVFHGFRAPTISIEKYLERIFKYANCSPSCFVVAYAYMDRFIRQQPGIPITSLNVHRLLITSVMVAAKFLDDAYYNNAYYAKVGGVTTSEMNKLEIEFLFRLDFRLQVTVSVFESYCSHLEREVSLGGRGTNTYLQVERSLQWAACGLQEGVATANNPQAVDESQKQQQQRVSLLCSYGGS